MYYVYILTSLKYPYKVYTGFTRHLSQRLNHHNLGKVSSTKFFRPWKIESYFAFSDQMTAASFEKYLKTASGIAFRRKRLMS